MATIVIAAATSKKVITRRRIIRLTRTVIITDRRIIRISIMATRHIRISLTKVNRLIRAGTIPDRLRTRTRTAHIRGNLLIRTSRCIIRRQDTIIITATGTIRRSGSTAVLRTRDVE